MDSISVRFFIIGLLLLAVSALSGSSAEVYRVGDSIGWTNQIPNVKYYTRWAASRTFYVGDYIVFDFDARLNNLVEVNLTSFRNCDGSSAMNVYDTSGSVIIPLTAVSHLFFISSFHCCCGQKVDIRVLSVPANPPPPKSPTQPKPRREEKHGEENKDDHTVKTAPGFIIACSVVFAVIVGSIFLAFIMYRIRRGDPIPPIPYSVAPLTSAVRVRIVNVAG
ncbi:hypothetical protein C5167_048417 [Papaver somniferum]|uniref:Phytocyanin domain-containing protein n=1 Tax=Papaver somniferum TaxID=3469 RepID=A0A4Y7KLG5_PAPSO|nr:cucumber peeling cupredoxin-like [Papaver somniferum]XP_026406810.1 cucumber peeling cupredoxin-like [Papaver somniferum]XP_026406815.1 cucumber peeling cupredoxin-like [Papaver somniferum]XP_026436011.1 cucumber peeling cupredoxin-like [Papaver somniferum]XP_026436012.1 cucumber peeling cupredoxin-like [Papaver somniferum]XP_026442730.1 cucumber peeling cupredoxin-like [Papaver somniferum]XP_026442731.1 cucumber peeling cupredoxin-like [Papaver somniferum]RZC72928.1 hypothetical protein 